MSAPFKGRLCRPIALRGRKYTARTRVSRLNLTGALFLGDSGNLRPACMATHSKLYAWRLTTIYPMQ